jgi:hypothetical protein
MDKRYHDPWSQDNFRFHRTDPKPWIPIDNGKDGWSFKGVFKWVIIWAALGFSVGFITNAKAEVLAELSNKAGGKIVITTTKCSTTGNVAYTTHPSAETQMGCWVYDESFIHIQWSSDNKLSSYPYDGWVVKKKATPL